MPPRTKSPHPTKTTDAIHFCGICNKTFTRRDLRDRHKRRCAKSSTRLPATKRKSCLSCVRSKVRCDLGSPACGRCRGRGVECRYTTVEEGRLRGEADSAEVVGGLMGSLGPGLVEGEGGGQYGDLDVAGAGEYQEILGEGAFFDTEFGSGEGWLGDIDLPPESLIRRPSAQSFSQDLIHRPETWSPDSNFSTLVELNSPFQGHITVPDEGQPTQTNQLDSISFPSPVSPSPIRLAIPLQLPTQTLISILLQIPAAMLNAQTYPPFIHHHLYPCSTGEGVPAAIANAYCALKAYEVAVDTSIGFVYSMMNAERLRLIDEFHAGLDMEGVLAAVHAMCMYQVIGFFDGDEAQARAARECNGVFLEMGRRLIGFLRGFEGGGEVEWKEWRVRETVLRTVHVVHAINVVSARQNGKGYEALDREVVGKLPVPCSGEVWRANNAMEWARARRKLEGVETATSKTSVGDIARFYGCNGWEMFERCHLMKLILSCVRA